jgi:acyl carrier protein
MEIEQKLIDIVREQKAIPDGALTRTTLLADAGLDSLDSLNVLFAVEEAFDISIPDERARAIRTLGDMVDLVAALLPSEH